MHRRTLSLAFFGALTFALSTTVACGSADESTPPPSTDAGGDEGWPHEEGDGGAGDATKPNADAAVAPLGECPAIDEGLVALEDAPLSVRVDATHVFYTTSTPQGAGFLREVKRAPKAGGAPEVLASTTRDMAAIALGNDTVYWLEPADGGAQATLRATSKGSAAARTVTTFAANLGTVDPFALAVDETNAYVLFRSFSGGKFAYSVQAAPLTGGAPTRVASHTLEAGTDVRSLELVGDDLYWGFSGGRLFHAKRTDKSANAELLVDETDGIDAYTIGATDVVFAQNGDLFKVPRAGGTKGTLAANARAYRSAVALTSGVAFSTRDVSGAEDVRVVRRDGSLCRVAQTDVKSVFSMASDGDRVFWTNTATRAAGGAVRWGRLPK